MLAASRVSCSALARRGDALLLPLQPGRQECNVSLPSMKQAKKRHKLLDEPRGGCSALHVHVAQLVLSLRQILSHSLDVQLEGAQSLCWQQIIRNAKQMRVIARKRSERESVRIGSFDARLLSAVPGQWAVRSCAA